MIAETRIETSKGSKYLRWLCGHFKIKVKDASYDDQQGYVNFPFGVCEMQAQPDELYIRVQAENAESFAIVKDVVGGHLERFAHKDNVQVTWIDQ